MKQADRPSRRGWQLARRAASATTLAGLVLGGLAVPAGASATTTFSIGDVSVVEGNTGTTNATFTITRGGDTSAADTIDFATAPNTATADVDYTTTAGTASFAAGATTATVVVPVIGDTTNESDETFFVNLTNASNSGVISDAQGVGTILDDELPLTLHGGGPGSGSNWFAVNTGGTGGAPTGTFCSGSPGLALNDATLDPAGTSPRHAQGDAFDTGLQLFVDNQQFVAPGTVDATSATGSLDSLTAGPQTLSGLGVTVQYKALQTAALLRTLATFTNSTAAPITATVTFQTNNGSDSGTGTRGTSSGDTTITTADNWVVTSDSASTPSDPVNTHVLAGPGTPAVLPTAISTTVCSSSGTEGIQGTYTITVPAGATRSLLFFNELSQTNEEALADATARFSTNPAPSADLVSDLSVTQLSELLNWSLAPLTVTKAADSGTSKFGETNGYTVTVANPNQDPVDLNSITDTLPAGFTYIAGSSTVAGSAVADPGASGQTLTWTGPFTVPAAGTTALHFQVKVPSTEGRYVDAATAAASGYVVNAATDAAPVQVVPVSKLGYRMVAADGGIFTFGDRLFHGSTGDIKLNKPIVGGATDVSDNDGYWIVASDGGVFTFNAPFFGSLGDKTISSPAVEIEPTPTGKGYFIVLADGKVYTFGDANFFGDMSSKALNKPVIGMTVTPTGKGYWLVAQDGGIFNFGDAEFFGSMGDKTLNAPIIDLAPSVDNQGYYLLGRDGGVFSFGSADFKGSTGDLKLNAPVIAMLVAPNGSGYWLAASDGGIFTFGSVPFLGSMGDTKLNSPVLDLIS